MIFNVVDFKKELSILFPTLKKDIFDEDYDPTTFQVGILARYLNELIIQKEYFEIDKGLSFINDLLLINDDEIEGRLKNSLVISCVGKLNLRDISEEVKLRYPQVMHVYEELMRYY